MNGSMPSARHRLEYGGVRLALTLDRLLGPQAMGALAAGAARLAYRPAGIRARLVEAHLRQAFPDRDERWIRRTAATSYAHLGREGLSMLRLSRLGRGDLLAATEIEEGLPELRSAVEAGTGAIMVAGHFGNWEIGGAALAARGIPMDAVVRRQTNPLFDRLINRARERMGMRLIPRHAPVAELLRALRAGRVLGLVADQDARDGGCFVPFLGRPASTFRGPAILALRSGAPLFVGLAVRRADGRYGVRLRPVPFPGDAAPDVQVRDLTAAHVAVLESAIRADPGQYLWHHRRWKTAAPGGERPGQAEV